MINDKPISDNWNILIIDDNEDIHTITKNAFFDEVINGKQISFLSAYTEKEALTFLKEFHQDIVVLILDLVLGDNGAEGCTIINYINKELHNSRLQIILRTGYYKKQEVKKIELNYPQVLILEKGETDVDMLIQIVTDKINIYINQ